MSMPSRRHSEEPPQGVSRRVPCAPSFCVLRSSARPRGQDCRGQDCQAHGVRLCQVAGVSLSFHRMWSLVPGDPRGQGRWEWAWGRQHLSWSAQRRHSRDPIIRAVPWGHIGRGRDSLQMTARPGSHSWWDVLEGFAGDRGSWDSMLRAPGGPVGLCSLA